jgi:hypothetical protein
MANTKKASLAETKAEKRHAIRVARDTRVSSDKHWIRNLHNAAGAAWNQGDKESAELMARISDEYQIRCFGPVEPEPVARFETKEQAQEYMKEIAAYHQAILDRQGR